MRSWRLEAVRAGGVFVTGTDTEVGKTVVAAALAVTLNADYWKPIQAGDLEKNGDSGVISNLGIPTHPNAYALTQALSPHEAARRDGVEISLENITLPKTDRLLVVEGAGGLLVPLNNEDKMIDLMARLKLPVILVARSGLGTINHTLLSLEALAARSLEVLGVVMNGPPNAANREAIEKFGHVPVIAELPRLSPINRGELAKHFGEAP